MVVIFKQSIARPVAPKYENSNRECKHDVKKSEVNMVNPILTENVQGWKHHGSCTFAEPELLSYRKPKCVVQTKRMTIKILIIVTTIMIKIMMKYYAIKEIVKGAHYDTKRYVWINSHHSSPEVIDICITWQNDQIEMFNHYKDIFFFQHQSAAHWYLDYGKYENSRSSQPL